MYYKPCILRSSQVADIIFAIYTHSLVHWFVAWIEKIHIINHAHVYSHVHTSMYSIDGLTENRVTVSTLRMITTESHAVNPSRNLRTQWYIGYASKHTVEEWFYE